MQRLATVPIADVALPPSPSPSPLPFPLPSPSPSAAPDVMAQLSELTGSRDRERLDVTLVTALSEMLRPQAIAVSAWAPVGVAPQQRWLKRARLAHGEPAATFDAPWIEFESLDALEQHPQRALCLASRQVQIVDEFPARGKNARCITLFPLLPPQDADAVAVIEVETSTPLDAEKIRIVCGILGIYQNFQSLLDYSEFDTLTGLLNRKTFDNNFFKVSMPPSALPLRPEPGSRNDTAHKAIYLGVIDIDHFKSVNDTYGHLIGDEVLLLLSRLMRSTFRFSDRLYRFGGEEFLVMMQCGSDAEAMIAFERLRSNTQNYRFPQVGSITISTGYTQVEASDAPSSAFQRADKALYYAKKHGRNQVRSHAQLMAASEIADASVTGGVELF